MNTTRFADFRAWAHARNLITGSTPIDQLMKTIEEFGELAHGINKGRLAEIKDGIGDVAVTLVIAAEQMGIKDFDVEPLSPTFSFSAKKAALEVASLIGALADFTVATSVPNYAITRRTAISKIMYGLDHLARSYGLTFGECCDAAWAEIKDRKGRMSNGVFIKEGD